MKKTLLITSAFLSVPLMTFAQAPAGTIGGNTLGDLLLSIIVFINSYVVPFIWAIAFLIFLWGVFQYFIAGGADEEKRSQGRQFVIWSVIAFFVMSSLWGIVNLLDGTFTFGNESTPDIPTFDTTP